jgi:GNAT superfamily N-acetyltransferase
MPFCVSDTVNLIERDSVSGERRLVPRDFSGLALVSRIDFDPDSQRPMKKSVRERLRLVPGTFRRRGPLVFFLMAVREILSPVMYWHVFHIFETDIQPQLPKPDAQGGFAIKTYAEKTDLGRVVADIAPMGELTGTEIESRLNRGQVVAVAYAQDTAVGYSWINFSDGLELVWGTQLTVRSDEAVFYDSFTLPRWRGRGVHHSLDAAMSCYARQRGRVRILGWVSVLNRPSLSFVKRLRKTRIMTLILVHVRLANWVYRQSIGAQLESRFSVSSSCHNMGIHGTSSEQS